MLICIAASLLVAALAVPLVQTLIAQVGLMVPGGDEAVARHAHRILQNSIGREPQLVAVDMALRAADRGETQFDQFKRADSGNGLYAYLELLPSLAPAARLGDLTNQNLTASRPAGSFAANSRSAEDVQLATRVHDLATAGPVRLYTGRWRSLALEAQQAAGVSGRLAARGADGVLTGYSMVYRPVLRELAGRLLAQGRAWREAGRSADALAAQTAVIRLMMNLVDDSPRPEVVLLAAEYVSAALLEITSGAGAVGLSADIVERGLASMARLEDLRAAWQSHKLGETTNLLPHTGDVAPARGAHNRVLGSMLASGYCAGTWLALAAVCVVLLPFAGAAWRSGATAEWRWNGWGRLVAVGIVITPMMAAALVFLAADLPLGWLLSFPSTQGFVLPVLLVPVLVGLAAWVCVELPAAQAAARIPRQAVWIMAAVAVGLLVVAALLPVQPEAWRPPRGVQLFRRLGALVGVESLILMLVWTVWGLVRRRRLKLSRGPLAAASLAVASWAWAATAVIGLAILQVNATNDTRHEEAFLAASADPLADRVGPGWRQEYFKKTQELLARLDESGRMAKPR